MITIDSRLKKLLEILLNSRNYITVDQIAKILNVSNRTIRNDLDKLEEIVELEGLNLIRKPGVGIKLRGSEKNIQIISRKINMNLETNNYNRPFSPERRRAFIIKELFFSRKQVTAQSLSERLFVSINTIYNDLDKIEKWLKERGLSLLRNRNSIKIVGKEENYRKAVSYYLAELSDHNLHEDMDELYEDYHGRIDPNTLFQLKQIVDLDYSLLEEKLEDLERQLDFKFSESAFINLVIHIAVTVRRIEEGKDILMPENILNSIVHTDEFKLAKNMTKELEEEFNLKIPESEIGYITLHVLGSKMYREDLSVFQLPVEELEDLGLPLTMAKEIAQIASKALNMDLTEDERFLSGLVLHLRPTINRVRYGLALKNPILDDIKNNYPEIYGVSWMTSVVFEKYLGVNIPESEIGYIAMHIGAAVERNREKIKTMVICHTGIGTSQLLTARLKKSFSELDLVGIRSSIVIEDRDLNDVDLIISTVPIRTRKPYILVNPILGSKDIKLIEKFIEEYYDRDDTQKPLDKEVFFNVSGIYKKEKILTDMCLKLEERGYVTKDFVDTVIEREKIVSTEIGKGLVIPHGLPKEVKKSCIGLTVLDRYMRWDEENVKYVLMICLNEKDLNRGKKIFKNLSDLIEKDEFCIRLGENQNSAKEVLALLEK